MKKLCLILAAILCIALTVSCQSTIIDHPTSTSTPITTKVSTTPIPTDTPLPTPALSPTIPPLPLTSALLFSNKSPYEILPVEGWGEVTAVRNSKVYYLSSYCNINVLDATGQSTTLLTYEDDSDRGRYANPVISHFYVTEDENIFFIGFCTESNPPVIYKVDNGVGVPIVQGHYHDEYVGGMEHTIYVIRNKKLYGIDLKSCETKEVPIDKSPIFSINKLSFDLVPLSVGDMVRVSMIDRRSQNDLGDFSVPQYAWDNMSGYYAFANTVFLFSKNLDNEVIELREIHIEDQTCSIHKVQIRDYGSNIDLINGLAFISTAHKLYCYDLNHHKLYLLYSDSKADSPFASIAGSYIFVYERTLLQTSDPAHLLAMHQIE